MLCSQTLRRFAAPRLLVAAVALGTTVCLADAPRTPSDQPWAMTDHIVGDTVAHGIEFVLKPLHIGLSRTCFRVSRPPEPRHIAEATLQKP